MLMVATPLVETLRRQADTLTQLQEAQRRVAPMHANAALQQALIDHRLLAAASLGGQRERETDRRAQQGVVDLRVDVLEVALTAAREPQALVEHGALRDDWRGLAARIGNRRIDAAGSDLRHRLLLDQTIQIGDLLATAPPAGDDLIRARLAWQALPALERALVEAASEPGAGEAAARTDTTRAGSQADWRPSWQQAWQRVVRLEQSLPSAPAAARAPDEDALRQRARAALEAIGTRDGGEAPAARVTPEAGQSPVTTATGAEPARRDALPALRAWGDALRAADGRARSAAVARAEAMLRAWQIGSLTGLLVLVGGAVALWRRLPRAMPADEHHHRAGDPRADDPPSPPADATPRSEASRLLGRLREPSHDRAQPQDTGY
jgi:hypothetical protein